MIYSPRKLKKTAKTVIFGNLKNILLCYYIYFSINFVLSFFTGVDSIYIVGTVNNIVIRYIKQLTCILILNCIANVLAAPFKVGFIRCVIRFFFGVPTDFKIVLSEGNNWHTIMLAAGIKNILILAVSAYPIYIIASTMTIPRLLLLIWCFLIMAVYVEFSFLNIIFADNYNITLLHAFIMNKFFRKGHRWHIINIMVSFIPLIVLGVLTVGMIYCFIEIYYIVTMTILYETIKIDSINKISKINTVREKL